MTAATLTVTESGVYDGMPAEVYFADPVPEGSLSHSGSRLLLPPSCPALFRWWRAHGQKPRDVFDIGHAAHQLVLGVGQPIARIEAENWQTRAARDKRDAARAAGMTPLLAADHDAALGMADAVRKHPIASALFQPGSGKPEQSLFWRDPEFDCWRRARLDWLSEPHPLTGRLIVPDLKTTSSAEPAGLGKKLHDFGYYTAAAWYLASVTALGLAGDVEPAFVFVFVEKSPPHLITIAQPDQAAVRWGEVVNRKAIDVWQRCVAADSWPGYSEEVVAVSLPPWAERQHEAAYERGDYDIEDVDR